MNEKVEKSNNEAFKDFNDQISDLKVTINKQTMEIEELNN